MSYDQNLADCEASLADLAAIVNAQGKKLNEANKLLDQTIEVLGIAIWALDSAELNARIADDEHVRRDVRVGITKAQSELKPLLDNLKARGKEGAE